MVHTRNKLNALPVHYKILRVLYELSGGKLVPFTLENIAVAVFKRFPKDMAMAGYPQYPDTMKVSRRLYSTLKPQGLIRTAGSKFLLTDMGIDVADKLMESRAHKSDAIPRALSRELHRILSSQAYALFVKGEADAIIDSDFYEYLGASVRTSYNELLGRIASVERVIRQMKVEMPGGTKASKALLELHTFLLKKFARELEFRRSL